MIVERIESMSQLFMILSSVSFNQDSVYLICFVGIGSSKQVDDLDEEIRELSSGKSMGVKDSMSAPCCSVT